MSAYDLNAEVIWQRKRIAELEAEVQALTEKEPGFAAVMLRLAAAESRVAELQTENERLRDEDSDFQREQEAENESLRATQDRLVADLLAAESREKELRGAATKAWKHFADGASKGTHQLDMENLALILAGRRPEGEDDQEWRASIAQRTGRAFSPWFKSLPAAKNWVRTHTLTRELKGSARYEARITPCAAPEEKP